MGDTFGLFVGIFEFIASISCIVGFLSTLAYYAMPFIEERAIKIKRFLQILTWFVIVLAMFMPFAGFPNIIFFLTLATHGIWQVLLYTKFPFVFFGSPDFLCAFAMTIINHCAMMVFALSELNLGVFETIAYFLVFIWAVPAVFIISLTVTDEAIEGSKRTAKSVWTAPFQKAIAWIKSKLPHRGDKLQ